MVQIVGCCHPKARNNAYVGPQLTQKRMQSEWMHLRGLPLLDNHDKRKKVGHILEAWVDGEEQLWIRAEVDETTAMGAETARRIRSGEYRGLSLGMRHGVDETRRTQSSSSNSSAEKIESGWEGVREVFWSNIEEVSVCERGKWPNTVLHSHFSEDPDLAPACQETDSTKADDSGITLFLSLSTSATTSENNNKKSSSQSDNPTQAKPACINTKITEPPLTPFVDSFQKFYQNHHHHQHHQRKLKMSEQSVPIPNESSSTPPTTAAIPPVPAAATNTDNSKGRPSPLPRETDGRFSAYLSTRGASFLCVLCV